MFYVLTNTDGSIKQYPYTLTDLRLDHKNISFGNTISDSEAAIYNVYPVEPSNCPTVDYTKNIIQTAINNNGKWIEKWVVVDASPELIAEKKLSLIQENKELAKQYIADTDWTQYEDVSSSLVSPYLSNKDEFIVYRNKLRNIIVNTPVEVTWPTKPEAKWM